MVASSLPKEAFGYFLVSAAQGFVANPGGSMGNLCLSGAIGRYVGPGQIQSTGDSSTLVLDIDLTAIPGPGGTSVVSPGDTWKFQTWHRDIVGGGQISNLTDAVSMVWR